MTLVAPGGAGGLGSLGRERPVLPALPWVPCCFRELGGRSATPLACVKEKGAQTIHSTTSEHVSFRAW